MLHIESRWVTFQMFGTSHRAGSEIKQCTSFAENSTAQSTAYRHTTVRIELEPVV